MEENLLVKLYFSSFVEKKNFKGEALSVSSKNGLGNFDILPYHSNFITLIFDELTIKTASGKEIKHSFTKGVLEVKENKVNIFLGL